MLKIIPFFLGILGFYLLSSISIANSQNYDCYNDEFGNYECDLGDQDVLEIPLVFPTEGYGFGVDTLPQEGILYYYDTNYEKYNSIHANPLHYPNLYIYASSEIFILFYEPRLNFDGQDEFTYFMTNNFDDSLSGTVTINGTSYIEKQFIKSYDPDKLGNKKSGIEDLTSQTRLGPKYWYVQYFENGIIHIMNDKTHVIYGDIFTKWQNLGGLKGELGYPVSNVKKTDDVSNVTGFFQEFKNGAIYLVNNATKEVHGDIYKNWIDSDRHLTLGFPIDDEKSVDNGTDKFSNFQHGKLYWNASTGVVTCHGKCN